MLCLRTHLVSGPTRRHYMNPWTGLTSNAIHDGHAMICIITTQRLGTQNVSRPQKALCTNTGLPSTKSWVNSLIHYSRKCSCLRNQFAFVDKQHTRKAPPLGNTGSNTNVWVAISRQFYTTHFWWFHTKNPYVPVFWQFGINMYLYKQTTLKLVMSTTHNAHSTIMTTRL